MAFTELNSVEHFILHKLSRTNLNTQTTAFAVAEDADTSYGHFWHYRSPEQLDRSVNEVLLEDELKSALIRLNPEIAEKPERADEVIHILRGILGSVSHTGLVRANEEFLKWVCGEKSMPFGENNSHRPVRVFDFENIANNHGIVTNQFRIHHRETKIPMCALTAPCGCWPMACAS